MYQQVSVIPADSAIVVNGVGLRFAYDVPEGVHAIQWRGESGHIEWTDGRPNTPLGAGDYAAKVKPYADLWDAEKSRIAEPLPPTPGELAAQRIKDIKARLTAIDLAMIRGLEARDEGTATAKDEAKLAERRAEKRALREELQTLTQQEQE
jgi:hypothetical protein